jgi:hypothetical protein
MQVMNFGFTITYNIIGFTLAAAAQSLPDLGILGILSNYYGKSWVIIKDVFAITSIQRSGRSVLALPDCPALRPSQNRFRRCPCGW